MSSRQSESLAAKIVQTWLGASGSVSLPESDHGPDFEINYLDGSRGIGEVKLDANTVKMEAEALIYRSLKSQCIPLKSGSGLWSVEVASSANIKALKTRLPELIEDLVEANINTQLGGQLFGPSATMDFDYLGIKQLHKINALDRDQAVIFPPLIAGLVPTDSNSATPWVEDFVRKEQHGATWRRLKESAAREKHLFIWINNDTPESLQLRVSFHPNIVPTTKPALPSWITHLWIGIPMSFDKERYVWLYNKQYGWKAIAIADVL